MKESLYNWMSHEMVQAICWGLLHSLWMGLLAAGVTGLVIAATPRSRPVLRYNLLAAVLLAFSIAVVGFFLYEYNIASAAAARPSLAAVGTGEKSFAAVTYNQSAGITSSLQPVVSYFNGQAGWIVGIWLIIFLFQLARLLAGLHYIHRIRNLQTHPVPGEWIKKAVALSGLVGIRQQLQFLQSGLVKVPVVVGMLRPVILLPLGLVTQMDPKFVEAILLHELAHIRRKDFAVNLLQAVLESVFFFNPAVLWISSLLREEREACCDDMVLAHTTDKRDYLQALLSFQEQEGSFAMALHTRKTFLLHRVRRMLTNENKKLNIMERILLISGLMLFSAFAFLPAAQEVEKPAPPPLPKVEISKPPAPAPEAIPAKPAVKATPVIKGKWVAPPMPPKPVVDTVPAPPAKSRITSMSTNANDNGSERTSEVTAVTADGHTYLIKKVNGETVVLSVDGKNIPKEQMNQYSDILQEMDARELLAKQKREQEQELRQQEVKRRMQERTLEQAKRTEERNERLQKKQEERNVQLLQEKMQRNQEALQQKKMELRQSKSSGNNDVTGIIEDLSREKIISSPEELSFTLTEKELVVNGNRQDASLQQRLKERYNLKSGDLIQYRRSGGSTTTTINRN